MLTGIMLTLIAVFSFVLVLSFLVFFHELGHYSVARFFGIAVDRFSIGFGKPICCLLYTSPSPRDKRQSRMPSSA